MGEVNRVRFMVKPDMSAAHRTEAELDTALAIALYNDEEFAQWFLQQTIFGAEAAKCVLCRADNPWSRVRLERENPETGELVVLTRDCETDVLVVYEAPDGRRLALHIENKLEGGSFTPLQPELYRERLSQWRQRAKLGRYDEATSVLVAPRAFYENNLVAAQIFDSYVSHEEIALRLQAFAQPGVEEFVGF